MYAFQFFKAAEVNLMLCLALINIDEALRGLCCINGSLLRVSLGGAGTVNKAVNAATHFSLTVL